MTIINLLRMVAALQALRAWLETEAATGMDGGDLARAVRLRLEGIIDEAAGEGAQS